MHEPIELPLVSGERSERADAARNRAAILQAAQRLLCGHGTDSITMDRVAEEADVGKGTLFRRFGDRAGLFHALLDDTERRLQDGFIRGPAPLGPGALPAERIIAFGRELLALTEQRGDLLVASRPAPPGLWYGSPVHITYRVHLRALLAELGSAREVYLADVLLAALAPELVLHQLRRGMSLRELTQSWEELVRRVTA